MDDTSCYALSSKLSETTGTKTVRRIVLRVEAELSSLIDGENQFFGELFHRHIVTQWLHMIQPEGCFCGLHILKGNCYENRNPAYELLLSTIHEETHLLISHNFFI